MTLCPLRLCICMYMYGWHKCYSPSALRLSLWQHCQRAQPTTATGSAKVKLSKYSKVRFDFKEINKGWMMLCHKNKDHSSFYFPKLFSSCICLSSPAPSLLLFCLLTLQYAILLSFSTTTMSGCVQSRGLFQYLYPTGLCLLSLCRHHCSRHITTPWLPSY